MYYLTEGEIYPSTWTDCKVVEPAFYFCAHYSSCLLIAMTVEKCFALYFPLHTKSICTVRVAKKISLAIGLLLFAFNLHKVFTKDVVTLSNGMKTCVWVHVPDKYPNIFFRISAFLYSFIPLTVMFTANCLIILKFMLAKWRNRQGGTESVNQALSKSAVKGTVMLLTVSFAFVILTGPICIHNLIVHKNPPKLLYGVIVILQYLNHSITGVLYCITGSRFREELMDLFNCGRRKRNGFINMSISHISSTAASISVKINET